MNTLSDADQRFLAAFENCELAAQEFGHREHVRLAYIYLSQQRDDDALDKLQSGLQRFLAHLGAPSSKYHETLTRAWLLAVRHFMHAAGPTSSFAEFIASDARLLDQCIMETHYTPGLLWSDAARARFVEPDLQPIPTHVG